MQELRFDGRVALVTGAASGMGRTHALLLARRGARLVINDLPGRAEEVDAVCQEIRDAGGEAMPAVGTVGHADDADRIVRRTMDKYRRIDIVLNNAGIPAMHGPLVHESPTDMTERQLSVHVRGPLQLNRAAWPHMIDQSYGRILFTGSANALGWRKGPKGHESDYSGAKAAVFAIARQTAAAGAEHNITANVVMPWAYTPLVAQVLEGTELGDWMKANLRPEQVSNSILFLLHEDCPVSGEAISSAGGRIARVFYASTRGYFNPDLTPEDVLANYRSSVHGELDESGAYIDAFEVTQPREEAVLDAFLRADDTASLDGIWWVHELPLRQEYHKSR